MKMYNFLFRVLFYSLLVFITITPATAQSGCNDFKDRCDGSGEPYKYSGQSKSGTFELGQSSSFKISAYGGYEYSMSLCAEKQLKGTFFRIRENSIDGELLYDGQAEGDNMNQKLFFIEDSKPLVIEVVVPEGDKPKQELEYSETIGCVSVIIEYYKVGKKGFE
jgi:hypothetical protein